MNKRELLRSLLAKQQAIVNAAKTGQRDMTPEEEGQFRALQGQIDALRPEAEAEERAEQEQKRQAAVTAERQRVTDITTLCRSLGEDPDGYIRDGKSIEEVRAAILDGMIQTGSPARVRVQKDEMDKFRAAAADALMIRAGNAPQNTAEGAADMAGMSLRDLAIECQVRDHNQSAGDLMRKSMSDLYGDLCRDFFNPTATFPAIMDSAINKSIVHIYKNTNTTFERITRKGTLKDFKRTDGHDYLIGGVGDLLLVPENGELKADTHKEATLPTRKLDTYGRQFSMSRQAFINDDIGFLSEVPGMYAAKAKRQINKAVYSILYNNGTVYDGKTLFHEEHGNLMKTAGAPSLQTLQAIIQKLQMQKDPFGEQIIVTPAALVLPVGYGFTVGTLFASPTINTADNTQAANPFYNSSLSIVEDPTLNALAGTNACPWFLAASQSDVMGIQVDYLNGQEMPTFRRMEVAGQLGFVWDIYLDWGITVMDWRGFVKNPGEVINLE
ncbi:MAG: hypothetical protein Q4C60_07565 [Eubacteriales bacterium]|nr:hypothetical protein [Eubacteriales bacterium]